MPITARLYSLTLVMGSPCRFTVPFELIHNILLSKGDHNVDNQMRSTSEELLELEVDCLSESIAEFRHEHRADIDALSVRVRALEALIAEIFPQHQHRYEVLKEEVSQALATGDNEGRLGYS